MIRKRIFKIHWSELVLFKIKNEYILKNGKQKLDRNEQKNCNF